jgi:hypothetical protein
MFSVASVIGRRACAVLALTSAGLHAAMLGHASNVVAGGLLAAMIVACVYCARDLWLRGTPRTWCAVGLMNMAMIAVHLPAPLHHHGMHMAMPGQQSTLMGLATAIAAVEAAVAMAVLYYRTRTHAQLISGTPAR